MPQHAISIHAPREGCDAFLPRSGRPADHFNPRTPRGVRRRRFMGLSSLDQFQSTHPARGATWREGLKSSSPLFQSTHPARGATSLPLWRAGRRRDFNPRTPRGVRLFKTTYTTPDVSFQSTHPARGATVLIARPGIHPLISIHAPREGCDRRSGRRFPCRRNFNPRTPRGVRHRAIGAWQAELEFQSTHPARGATPSKIGDRGHNRISIHAPREGCDAQLRPQSEGHIVISIHAPREGCDLDTSRGCTQGGISIHAPREGCDRERARSVGGGGDFNPRTPRGVRPQDGAQRFPVIIISIHAPREGCDVHTACICWMA